MDVKSYRDGQELELEDVTIPVDTNLILGAVGIDYIINYFGKESFLNEIGEDACKKHFGIEEQE